MVNWPALLKLQGDDELIYLRSHAHFEQECHDMILSEGDHLVDCLGHCFVCRRQDGRLVLQASGHCYSVSEVCQLIQAHEFAAAQVCVTKIYFATIEQAVKAMAF